MSKQIFKDAACTQPAEFFGSLYLYAFDYQLGKLYQRGPAISTIYYLQGPGMCISGGPQTDYYELGNEVPLTDFVPAVEMIN